MCHDHYPQGEGKEKITVLESACLWLTALPFWIGFTESPSNKHFPNGTFFNLVLSENRRIADISISDSYVCSFKNTEIPLKKSYVFSCFSQPYSVTLIIDIGLEIRKNIRQPSGLVYKHLISPKHLLLPSYSHPYLYSENIQWLKYFLKNHSENSRYPFKNPLDMSPKNYISSYC